MNEDKILLNSIPMDEIEDAIDKIKTTENSRINATPDNAHEGLTQLVKQAIRRVESGSLSEDEIERLGETLMKLEMKMEELKEIFNLTDEDLNINLGPLGGLM
jgi:regulator of sirC expression with transglutaminase-like and TPR domain